MARAQTPVSDHGATEARASPLPTSPECHFRHRGRGSAREPPRARVRRYGAGPLSAYHGCAGLIRTRPHGRPDPTRPRGLPHDRSRLPHGPSCRSGAGHPRVRPRAAHDGRRGRRQRRHGPVAGQHHRRRHQRAAGLDHAAAPDRRGQRGDRDVRPPEHRADGQRHPRGQGQRRVRQRHRHRRPALRHRDRAPHRRGPEVRDRRQHPARHRHHAAHVQERRQEGRRLHRPLQPGDRDRRPGLHHQGHQGDVRPRHQQLHAGRLRRLQAHRRRRRRRRDLPRRPRRRPAQRAQARQGHARRRRQAGARLRARAPRHRRRLGHVAHPASAGVHRLPHAQGPVQRHAAEPGSRCSGSSTPPPSR